MATPAAASALIVNRRLPVRVPALACACAGFGSEDWSYHLNPQLTVALVWDVPRKFYAGVEIDLWWNKYQIPDSAAFDTNQQAVSLLFKYHF